MISSAAARADISWERPRPASAAAGPVAAAVVPRPVPAEALAALRPECAAPPAEPKCAAEVVAEAYALPCVAQAAPTRAVRVAEAETVCAPPCVALSQRPGAGRRRCQWLCAF